MHEGVDDRLHLSGESVECGAERGKSWRKKAKCTTAVPVPVPSTCTDYIGLSAHGNCRPGSQEDCSRATTPSALCSCTPPTSASDDPFYTTIPHHVSHVKRPNTQAEPLVRAVQTLQEGLRWLCIESPLLHYAHSRSSLAPMLLLYQDVKVLQPQSILGGSRAHRSEDAV
jgi:hypothetical protein